MSTFVQRFGARTVKTPVKTEKAIHISSDATRGWAGWALAGIWEIGVKTQFCGYLSRAARTMISIYVVLFSHFHLRTYSNLSYYIQ